MKKWSVMLPYHASVYVKVEATTKKEAIEKAFDEARITLCTHCSDHANIDEYNDDSEPSAHEIES